MLPMQGARPGFSRPSGNQILHSATKDPMCCNGDPVQPSFTPQILAQEVSNIENMHHISGTEFYRKKPFSSPWLMMRVTCDVLYGYFEEKRPTMQIISVIIFTTLKRVVKSCSKEFVLYLKIN